jgi:RNA polymerase sigma-70 factor (ECF subfamily)
MSSASVSLSLDHPHIPARIRARDEAAIQAVVNAYLPQVLRAARGAGLDVDHAEDVAQATFATFIEKADTFDGRSHVRTWLFGILYKKILEARRELQKDSRNDDIDEVFEQRFRSDGSWLKPPGPIDTDVYRGEVREWLRECLDAVPLRQRLAFVLKEAEGFSSKEICNIMDITRTNLGAMLHRCRNRLRECLEAKGIRGSEDASL